MTDAEPCCDGCADLTRRILTPTDDYQGLKAGDRITVQWTQGATIPGEVIGTCEYGALVRCPKPTPGLTFDMYVRQQNRHGHWTA